jgi:hypothetical protein
MSNPEASLSQVENSCVTTTQHVSRIDFVKHWPDTSVGNPLFPVSQVYAFLDDVALSINKALDRCKGSTGSTFLQGMRGIGKTTLLRGCHLAIASMRRPDLVSIYLDYEQLSASHDVPLAPLSILRITIEERLPEKANEIADVWNMRLTTTELLEQLYRKLGVVSVVFADEIHEVYRKDGAFSFDESKLTVKELLAVGKSLFSIGVVSTSRSSASALVFQQFDDDAPNELSMYFPASAYPCLNSTVYCERDLMPCRHPAEFAAVLKLCGVSADPQIVFFNTGGVGRAIDAYPRESHSHAFKKFVAAFMEDSNLNRVVSEILAPLVTSGLQFSPRLGFDYLTFRVADLGCSAHKVARWVDAGFLLQTSGLLLELTYPVFWQKLILELERSDPIYWKFKLALVAVMTKWDPEDSPGRFAERYVRALLAKRNRFGLRCADHELSFASENVAFCSQSDLVHNPRSSIDRLIEEVLSLSKDSGLDKFCIRHAHDDDMGQRVSNEFLVDLLQVKLGNSKITLGSAARKTTNNSNLPDTAHGILQKAENGWKELHKRLTAMWPEHTFKPGTFILATTRSLSDDAQTCVLSGNDFLTGFAREIIPREEMISMFPLEVQAVLSTVCKDV